MYGCMHAFSKHVCTYMPSLTSRGQITLQYYTNPPASHSEMYSVILEAYLFFRQPLHFLSRHRTGINYERGILS